MKKLLALVALTTWIGMAQAQQTTLPPGMNYQAVARDASGRPLSNKTILLRVNLLSEGPTGKAVYTEIHRVNTGESGLFNLIIGRGEAKGDAFSQIPWAEKNIWLELALAEGKKEEFAIIGSSQLLAVPYAYHAGSAETLHVHRPQEPRRGEDAARILDDAKALEAAGVFALVLELVPEELAEQITKELSIPVIGIGAGAKCDAQVLVWTDLMGITKNAPKLAKAYRNLRIEMLNAAKEYANDVATGQFPGPEQTFH
jgi:hypothetical protein